MATLPTTKTEISFASTWDAASPTWIDVTDYVRSIEINRGRAEDLNPFDSGMARVELDNRDGRFNPSNTASPYYPNVKPRKQIRLTSTYEVPTRTNLCTNPSFEAVGTTGWLPVNATIARAAGTITNGSGSWSAQVTHTTTGFGGATFNVSGVTPGNAYTASIQFLRLSGPRTYQLALDWYNGASYISTTGGPGGTGATSTRFTVTGTAPAAATNVVVTVYSTSAGAVGNWYQIDALLVEQSSTVNPYFDGSSPGAQWTGTVNASTSTSTRTNLISNPSFETNALGWNPNGSVNTRVEATWGVGEYAYRIVANAATNSGTFTSATYFSVRPGVPYTASYLAKAISGTLRRLYIGIYFSDAAGTFINQFFTGKLLTTEAQTFSITATSPAAAAFGGIFAYTLDGGTTGDIFEMDSVLVEQSATVNQYFDGSSSGISSWTGAINNSVSVERTTSWPLFRGYVQTWPQEYPQYGLDATSTITAVDGLAILGGMKTPIDEMAARISAGELPALYARWKLGDTDTTNPRYLDSSGNGRDLPVVMGQFTGPPMAKYLDDASSVFAYGNGSLGFATATNSTAYSISMWIQTTQTPAPGYLAMLFEGGRQGLNNVQVGLMESGFIYLRGYDYNPGFIPYAESNVRVNDGQPHHICITSGGGGIESKIYIDGVDRTTYNPNLTYTSELFGTWSLALSLSNDPQQQYYGYMQDVCVWFSRLSATQVGYVYGIGTGLSSGETTSARATRIVNAIWPGAPKTFATGYGYCSTSEYNENALNALQKIADTENGLFFVDRSGTLTFRNRYYWQQVTEGMTSQATLGDDQGIGYETMGFRYDADQMANTFVINSGIGVPQTAYDAATVSEYGSRTVTLDTLLSTVDALSMAQGLAAQYSTPVLRSEPFTVNMASDINATRLLNLELGYKFTLRRNALGVASTIKQNLSLNSVQHFIRPGSWVVTIDGSPREQYNWFTLDSSLLDGTDEIGY